MIGGACPTDPGYDSGTASGGPSKIAAFAETLVGVVPSHSNHAVAHAPIEARARQGPQRLAFGGASRFAIYRRFLLGSEGADPSSPRELQRGVELGPGVVGDRLSDCGGSDPFLREVRLMPCRCRSRDPWDMRRARFSANVASFTRPTSQRRPTISAISSRAFAASPAIVSGSRPARTERRAQLPMRRSSVFFTESAVAAPRARYASAASCRAGRDGAGPGSRGPRLLRPRAPLDDLVSSVTSRSIRSWSPAASRTRSLRSSRLGRGSRCDAGSGRSGR
jgi:hypothetical protein